MAAMRLKFLPANQAYVFTFGDQITSMGDERFFRTRAQAVARAAAHGLKVAKNGVVSAHGPNPFENRTHGTRNRSGEGETIVGRPYSEIVYRDPKNLSRRIVKRYKNSGALRAKVGKHEVLSVVVREHADGTANLSIDFRNGDAAYEFWMSASVLAEKLLGWRNLDGVPLEWNGRMVGEIHRDNEFLRSKAR